jgi:hypothetical protein
MKQKITITSIAFILLGLGGLYAQTATPPSIGNGTSGTPYEISTLDNLYWLTQNSTEWNKYYIQTANIDASSTNVWDASAGFTPIGNVTTIFSGSYDGQGNTINNLFINRPSEDYIGFIGSKNGPVNNLGITNVNITGKDGVGSIAGSATGLVDNCYSSGNIIGNVGVGGLVGGIPDTNNGSSTTSNSYSTCDVVGTQNVGGLAGTNGDVVSNCYSTGMVTGGTGGRTGGLIGSTWYGTILSCYSESAVTNTGDNTGGLVGRNVSTNIKNCYTTGSVNGTSYVGGLIGNHQDYNILNSYCIGSVSGSGSFVGGLVGDGASGGWGAYNSFWNTETTGQETSSGGIGATTVEMHSLCTYVDGVDASWDFMFESLNGGNDIWEMNATVNGGYPYLTWQGFTHTEECCGFIDITDPVLIVQNFALQLDVTGNAVLLLSDVVISATDNCSISDTTLSQVNFSCSDNTTTNVDVILSDSLGNIATQTVVITIDNSAAGTDTRTECDSLVWIDGNTYYSSNNVATYTIIGGTANTCDSIVTLDLTIINHTLGTDTRTECDSLVWIDGNTYYSSNNVATYTIMGGAANTCDSIVTLDLTIINHTLGTDIRTECDSLVWIDGNTYYSSNNVATYAIMGGATNTCDSIVTLDLTIINHTLGTDTRTECDSLVWIDGNTYYSSNNIATYTIMGGAANTCDSIVTLDLTINTVDVSVTTTDPIITANVTGAAYQWLNCNNNYAIITGEIAQTYTATTNGDYAVEITQNNCVDTSACIQIITIGIEVNSLFKNASIYPNPNNGFVNINLANIKNITIKIFTVSGKLIYQKENINTPTYQLKLNEPSGIYFMEIISANERQQYKLIIE